MKFDIVYVDNILDIIINLIILYCKNNYFKDSKNFWKSYFL